MAARNRLLSVLCVDVTWIQVGKGNFKMIRFYIRA